MIDIRAIKDLLYTPIKNYSEVPQLLKDNDEDIPEDKLVYPRIIFKISEPYNRDGTPEGYEKYEVPSDDPDFETDIEYKYITTPNIRVSFEGYARKGDYLFQYLNKVHNWFKIPHLGQRYFDDSDMSIVIENLYSINDRDEMIEGRKESRKGFDVILNVEETIYVTEKTIEGVKINQLEQI